MTDEILTPPEYSRPRIVVGDLNEWTRGLASRLMGHAFAEVKPGKFLRYSRTYPGILPMLHLDHFYYDKHLALKELSVISQPYRAGCVGSPADGCRFRDR